MITKLRKWSRGRAYRERVSVHFAGSEAVFLPSLVGLAAGIVTGLGMVAFRIVIEGSQRALLGSDDPESFETLGPVMRFIFPVVGALALGAWFQWQPPITRQVGVAHVLERLAFHDGHLPIRNAINQFIGGAISLISGHSAGREGPAIHIGATASSWMGDRAHLPNNTLRILVGCGSAAAIAASFNTPLAGVVFAMEVVLMEYTLAGFAPIILAAVSATAVSRAFFGADAAFDVPAIAAVEQGQLPLLLLAGIIIGALAAVLVRMLGVIASVSGAVPVWLRFGLAGVATGMIAIAAPAVMGIGYDTVNSALVGSLSLGALVTICLFKLLATAVGLGLGIPGGVIGPALVLGAAAGGALGIGFVQAGISATDTGALWVLIGMGAMMSATLHAPLAALTALLELTGDHGVVFPAMLAITAAYLTCRSLFRTRSVFETLMQARGIELRSDPFAQSLSRLGVARAMDTDFAIIEAKVSRQDLANVFRAKPEWLLIRGNSEMWRLLPAAEIVGLLDTDESEDFDLLELPLRRRSVVAVGFRSTLAEAHRRMEKEGLDALYVTALRDGGEIIGILTRESMEHAYRVR